MLKHVSVSPWRGRADSVSLASSGGASSCGSGSPSPGHTPPPSRASSCASLAPLTALSSFSPADATSQQVNRRKSCVSSYIGRDCLDRNGEGLIGFIVRNERRVKSNERPRWMKEVTHSAKRKRFESLAGGVRKAMTWLLNKANEENKMLSVTGVETRRFVKTRTKRFPALINSWTACVLARSR